MAQGGVRELAYFGRGYVLYCIIAHYFFFYGSILTLRSKILTERFTDIYKDKMFIMQYLFY